MLRPVKSVLSHTRTIRKRILGDPLNNGMKLRFLANYIRWSLFYKRRNKRWVIQFENGLKSFVYPFPDHDAGEANIFTRNVDYYDIQLIRKHLQKGDTVIDAGCNVGNRTLAIADLLSGALLIDAGYVAVKRTKEHLALNKLDPQKFIAVHCAVGENEGVVRFTDLGGANTANKVTDAQEGVKTIEVPLRTIDNLVTEYKIQPSFIKIDVEGFDFAAIKGAEATLRSGCVRLLKFEHFAEEPLAPIKDFFGNIGWTIFTLDKQGRPSEDENVMMENLNLFAAPSGYYIENIKPGK